MLSDRFLKIRLWMASFGLVLIYPLVAFVAILRVVLRSIWNPRKDISGEVALITGGGGGLGKEIAIRLAQEGCNIAVVDINEQAARSTSDELTNVYNIKAKPFKADVSKFDEVQALSRDVERQLGPVTILVNNAGITTLSTSLNPPPEDSQKMIDTNLTSNIWTVRVFLENMKQQRKGHIVSICSVAGVFLCHRQLEYTASKFGLRGFMDALNTELFALECDFIKTTTVFPYFLTTNSKVNGLFEKCGLGKYYPSITGVEAAGAVVDGILSNDLEVFIPGSFALLYRLFGLLPKWCQVKISNGIVSRKLLNDMEY